MIKLILILIKITKLEKFFEYVEHMVGTLVHQRKNKYLCIKFNEDKFLKKVCHLVLGTFNKKNKNRIN